MSDQRRGTDSDDTPPSLSRTIGTVTTLVGAGLVGWGVFGFAGGILSESGPETAPMGRYLALMVAGALVTVVGLGLLRVGYVRAASRTAGQAAPAAHALAGAVSDGLSGDTGSAAPCRHCGVGLAADARFCSSCGGPVS
jgi:hypothetical protein